MFTNAIIGVDPSITCTGLSLILIDNNKKFHYKDSLLIKPKKTLNNSKRLSYLYETMYDTVEEWKSKFDIPVIAGIEVPAVFLKQNRFSRDLTQRDSCTVCKLALTQLDIFCIGDEDNKPIRPNQIHAFGGVNKKGFGDGLEAKEKSNLKKQGVLDKIKKVCLNTEGIESFDISDSIACAIVAWKIYNKNLI